MKLHSNFSTPLRNNYSVKHNNDNLNEKNPSFKGFLPTPRELIEVSSRDGSLHRLMFFIIGTIFMVGGRYLESRSNDEKREVATRDIPAVALSCGAAPYINDGIAYGVTKTTGVPIVTNAKNFLLGKTKFASQDQLKNWYSAWTENENALMDFSKVIDENGGSIAKAMKKLGLDKDLEAITTEIENSKVIEALKNAKNTDAFKNLENSIKNLSSDNKLLKFAKNAQAGVKLVVIGFMAALLGYFLPHLNIVKTKKKYQNAEGNAINNNNATQDAQKIQMRTTTSYKTSSSVLSFHNASAKRTFKPLLDMVESESNN